MRSKRNVGTSAANQQKSNGITTPLATLSGKNATTFPAYHYAECITATGINK